ncbi:hypothetical protein HQ39_03990 [Porphyromonas sp. COT-108 OH2963]|uniref:FimB/Mfa2 family fimbrial subunit n=1 Tax=Porphyromonas sp. COT-108 OH2963 TaxID=1515614 RepID=UPI00052BECAC|nr:FimB/Mfa2 family fimbrial subunit [Porphyromonas sp. COT-108 OH2963]KGN95447.1 hypothetical protein HQ39_03990 [Porphyromonas sp. COT-108 OH2963]
MKKIIYTLIGCLMLSLAGCSRLGTDIADEKKQGDTGDVLVEFGAVIPGFKSVELRDNGGVENLNLLVFNQYGILIARRVASLQGLSGEGYRFSALLPKSDDIRTIHFIANHDWATVDDSHILGHDEASVVALMTTDRGVFWSRKELPNGIDAGNLEGSVSLLRNQAKVTVENQAANFVFEGFTLHNTLTKGTVAPYNTTTFKFQEGSLNEPLDIVLNTAVESNLGMGERFLFERKNGRAKDITTAIIKGKYQGGASTYYKIDLIDADKKRYDIERNYHYKIIIKNVHKGGSPTFAAALQVASHNNTALDPTVEKYPVISDGVSKLEVERTLIILTKASEDLITWAKYYPDLNNPTFNNEGVTCRIEQETGKEVLAAGSLQFNTNNGEIRGVAINQLPPSPREARIIVSKGDFLARVIRVVLRMPYSFGTVKINTSNTVPSGQEKVAKVYFNIPSDFPADLFPLYIEIKANTLYPVQQGVQVVTRGSNMYHIFRVTSPGTKEVHFKTNSVSDVETVEVSAEYFAKGSVSYTRS